MVDRSSVVVIGDALIDEIRGDGPAREFVGGAALNVAVGLATLGVPTSLIAMVGDDEAGEQIRAFLIEHDVTLVPTIGPHGSSRAVSDRKDGEPFYVFNEAAQARSVSFGEAELAAIAAAELVVVSCFPFDDVAQSDALLAAVGPESNKLVIDPNPRADMMHDGDLFRETFDRLAPATALLKVGDDDAELLYGMTGEELSAYLLSLGSPVVLSTAGRRGAAVETRSGMVATAPIAHLDGPVIDTMGAGDATLASVITSILDSGFPATSEDWRDALERAMLIAAATCRHEGALLRLP